MCIYIYILVSLRAYARGGSNKKEKPTRNNLGEDKGGRGGPSIRKCQKIKQEHYQVKRTEGRLRGHENEAKIDRTSNENPRKTNQKSSQIAPGGPRDDRRRFGGLRGRSRNAPGSTRGARGTPPERLGTAPDAPGTSPSNRKGRPGGPESTFWSVLLGQSLVRRPRSDFRTFLGCSGEARTSILLRPASVL